MYGEQDKAQLKQIQKFAKIRQMVMGKDKRKTVVGASVKSTTTSMVNPQTESSTPSQFKPKLTP